MMLNHLLRPAALAVTLAATAAAPAFAQAQQTAAAPARETPPPPGKPRELKLPAIETYKLANGMQVTMIPFGSVPKVTLSLRIRAGRLDEGGKFGVADFTSALMNEGAAGQSAVTIAQRAGDMGGGIGVDNGLEFFGAGISVLSEFGPEATRLLADVVRRPNLPESELPRIKQDALRSLAIAKTSPQSLADDAFTKAFLPNHPFGHGLLTEQEVQAVTIDDIRRFHTEKLGAKRAHLYVAGQFDAAAMRQAIEAAFGDWQQGPEPIIRPADAASKLNVVLIDRPDAPQSTIYLGAPLPDPRAFKSRIPMSVANDVLGGSFTSRITLNLREDKGYTYSPSSSASYGTGYGQWILVADVTSAHTGDSLHEVFKEIRLLGSEPPSKEELEAKQNGLAGIWILRTATRGGLISSLAFYDSFGLPRSELEQYVGKVRAVTPQQVSSVISQYLKPDAMTLVIVGDLKTVRPQLQKVPEIASAVPSL
ncbi:M16 family metallopeptidase [Pedomonas mirosovicensis]|uniref:M16 family metallopeptidase n=1 Tax=Pedomonas mirosovicensis TaxID=2908641 RepID=UPI0021694C2A|nr:pitrilysin family protein [Pedomonas mirosovicensis]MCH8684161.1 insulinase family protein [Pedomonas mirosovicensis]